MAEKTNKKDLIADIISPGEKVLWKGRRNDRILDFYLFAGLAITILIAIFFYSQGAVYHELGKGGITSGKSIAAFVILIGFFASFSLYYNKHASRYVITDKKAIIQFGLFSRTIQYAYHDKTRHINIKQGLIGSLFNVGTVYIDSGRAIASEMHFREIRGMNMNPSKPKIIYYALKNVENPQKVYSLLLAMIEKSRIPKPEESLNEKLKEAEKKGSFSDDKEK